MPVVLLAALQLALQELIILFLAQPLLMLLVLLAALQLALLELII
jgi:hypothetical protein